MDERKKTCTILVNNFSIGENSPLTLISGPCVIEDEKHTLMMAERLKEIVAPFPIQLIFKASYDKANRSSGSSFRGPGMKKGLKILEKVKKEFDLPVVTDVHHPEEAKPVAEVCDMLQIPAFLCRQTDLILAAAATQKPIKVKKGQFLAPSDMSNIVDKIVSEGNHNILLTDRGTTFGYNNLVVDFRSIPIMQQLGYPVCFDASHSVQLPGGEGASSGGKREFIPTLAKAAIAAGCNAIYLETHNDPLNAKSDKHTVFPIEELADLLKILQMLYDVVHTEKALSL